MTAFRHLLVACFAFEKNARGFNTVGLSAAELSKARGVEKNGYWRYAAKVSPFPSIGVCVSPSAAC